MSNHRFAGVYSTKIHPKTFAIFITGNAEQVGSGNHTPVGRHPDVPCLFYIGAGNKLSQHGYQIGSYTSLDIAEYCVKQNLELRQYEYLQTEL